MFKVTKSAMRPASKEQECFYCHQPIGENHKEDCVLIKKKVKILMRVVYLRSVPASWSRSEIEFYLNDSSWCANNALDELSEIFDRENGECMCSSSTFDYVSEDSEPFLEEN